MGSSAAVFAWAIEMQVKRVKFLLPRQASKYHWTARETV